jgi:hypothetical protein
MAGKIGGDGMKKIYSTIIFLLFLCFIPYRAQAEMLYKIGEEDVNAMELIQGQWVIGGAQSINLYTYDFACKIDGLKYYYYSRVGARTSYPYVYTIVKSKKTGRSYFARGYYKDGRLYGNTSRIEFKHSDCFMVYLERDPEAIFFEAYRVPKAGKTNR